MNDVEQNKDIYVKENWTDGAINPIPEGFKGSNQLDEDSLYTPNTSPAGPGFRHTPDLQSYFVYTSILIVMIGLSIVLSAFVIPVQHVLAQDPAPAPAPAPAAPEVQRTIELLPLPAKYSVGSTVVCLSGDFKIEVEQVESISYPEDLYFAINRTRDSIQATKHQYLSPDRGESFRSKGCDKEIKNLYLTFEGLKSDNEIKTVPSIMEGAVRPPEERPDWESYKLEIPEGGDARVTAKYAMGLFRGMTSFANLLYFLPEHTGDENAERGVHYAPFAPYVIEDKPSFGWRSVLVDTSRHYFSVQSIEKILDSMAMVKLNVFHWHITDSQSWPLALSSMPELAEKGAYNKGRIYSEDDVKWIVSYAGHRGIDVLVEIDTPGHTASIHYSHPDYITCYDASPWATYANQPPAGQLRFADANVTQFVGKMFENTADLINSRFFGTGGDEINEACMYADPQTNASLASHNWSLLDALNHFTNETHNVLRNKGKTPVVWEEMVLDRNLSAIAKDTIVDVWIKSESAKLVADKGYRLVHASSDYFYLDCGHGAWVGLEGGGKSWCDPYKDWQHMYSFNPYGNITDEQRPLVLGGQVSSWNEQTDETNIETIIFPRANAIAELFWTGGGEKGFPRSSVDAFPRMHDARYRMVDRGVRAEPLQPEWCALRPGACDMKK